MKHSKPSRYFVYVRKSTTGEERQARSIGDQLVEIRDLIRKEGLVVVDRFEESRSAMTRGRPLFNEMLDRVEAGEADGIISWHPDRLARNAFDGGRVIDLLDEGKLRDLRFCSFWFENSAQGKLMLNLAFGQSKYYSDTLSVNVRRGQRQKTLEGVWAWKAPLGYLNDARSRKITVDPVKGPLVRRLFELYSTGEFSIERVRDTLEAEGLRGGRGCRISLSTMQKLLQNPFYYGALSLKGEMFEGAHTPLITKAQFDLVQRAMAERSKPNSPRLKPSVYRGLLKCGECGCTITMETQKGHNYLRCTKRVKKDCTQSFAREEIVTAQIADALRSVSLPDEVSSALLTLLDASERRGDLSLSAARAKLQARIDDLDLKLDRLSAAYLDEGAFSPQEFRLRKQVVINEKRLLLDDLAALDRSTNARFEPLRRFITSSAELKYVASRATPGELRSHFERIGSNLNLFERTVRWQPRGAWQLVVAKGSIAQHNTAPLHSGAVLVGESRLSPIQCG